MCQPEDRAGHGGRWRPRAGSHRCRPRQGTGSLQLASGSLRNDERTPRRRVQAVAGPRKAPVERVDDDRRSVGCLDCTDDGDVGRLEPRRDATGLLVREDRDESDPCPRCISLDAPDQAGDPPGLGGRRHPPVIVARLDDDERRMERCEVNDLELVPERTDAVLAVRAVAGAGIPERHSAPVQHFGETDRPVRCRPAGPDTSSERSAHRHEEWPAPAVRGRLRRHPAESGAAMPPHRHDARARPRAVRISRADTCSRQAGYGSDEGDD